MEFNSLKADNAPVFISCTDQMGRTVKVPAFPKRIISLVPSQTELLFDLGLEDRIVGITKFCIHPAGKVKAYPKIGGTKKFRMDAIAALQPDLIIGNKEENYREGIEYLEKLYPVWMSDIFTLQDATAMMRQLGKLTGTLDKANEIAATVESSFEVLEPAVQPKRVAYFIWKDPYIAVGHTTFIHEMLGRCGWINVFEELGRYPEVEADMLKAAQPQLILLSSEPYPFKEKHIEEFKQLCPESRVELVDGELFSWYGSRLLQSAAYFHALQEELAV
jgi:ABC-type Fe3+-hydroxamate transport system substrate-binding protein